MVALPWLASRRFGYPPERPLAWLALVALVVAIGVWRVWGQDMRGLALSASALVSATMLAGAMALLPSLNVEPEAAFVKQAMRARAPIATVESNNGLFGYTGRLHRPVPWISRDQILAWCRAHPNGILLTMERHDEPKAGVPFETWPYFLSGDRRISAWHASSILATDRASR
jgi:hypothetical protein